MKRIYLNTLTPEETIKRLKNGEVIKSDAEETIIKMIEGNLVKTFDDGVFILNPYFISTSEFKFYFEEPEEFKVEKAGIYKTRDGRIAYVTRMIEKRRYGIITGSSNVDTWKDSGIYCSSGVNFVRNI